MHTRPPVLTALHSTYAHLTSARASAQTHPPSAYKNLQLTVLAMLVQVIVHAPPAFHLFYGEPGWQGASIHMRLTCKQHTQVCTLPQQSTAAHSRTIYLHSCFAMLDCFSGLLFWCAQSPGVCAYYAMLACCLKGPYM